MSKIKPIEIWDLPLRLFHWLLVLFIIAAYILGNLGGVYLEWHIHAGIVILSLLAFRLVWGFVGSTHSRFRHFVPSFPRLYAYLLSPKPVLGHSPLAALWIIVILLLLLFCSASGLFSVDDEIGIEGPFSRFVTSSWNQSLTGIHFILQNLIQFFVALHLIAIAFYLAVKGNNLLLPMVTGKSYVQGTNEIASITRNGRLPVCIALGVSISVFCLIESVVWLERVAPLPDKAQPNIHVPIW